MKRLFELFFTKKDTEHTMSIRHMYIPCLGSFIKFNKFPDFKFTEFKNPRQLVNLSTVNIIICELQSIYEH